MFQDNSRSTRSQPVNTPMSLRRSGSSSRSSIAAANAASSVPAPMPRLCRRAHVAGRQRLERGDRMSMAVSLEPRPPFLERRLVELAFTSTRNVKVRGQTTKWIVKETARQHLPADIVDRPKLGFKVPLDDWFRSGLRDMAFGGPTGPSSFIGTTFLTRAGGQTARLAFHRRSQRATKDLNLLSPGV
jgi:asparagine synthetase B (glutamine-hydrolysing)